MVAFDCFELPGQRLPLGRGWVARFEPTDRGALLRLQNPRQPTIDVEIVLTAAGPVVRAAAAALEITAASEIVARCDEFRVDARRAFSVQAGEVAVAARTGGVAIRANDDVAVDGEQILLNCDRDPPLPSWLPQPTAPDEG